MSSEPTLTLEMVTPDQDPHASVSRKDIQFDSNENSSSSSMTTFLERFQKKKESFFFIAALSLFLGTPQF